MTAQQPTPTSFSIDGELPSGTTMLQASAGTGKTWTIAALVTRYVAEGHHTLDELLVVTFGRAASQELRERVREQLTRAAGALESATGEPASTASSEVDPLMALLLSASPAERAVMAARLRTALASFDDATIATIHQFCQRVLAGLGIAGDTDSEARLVDDLDDLLVEVVDDVYLRRFADRSAPPFSRSEALQLSRTVTDDPQARILPDDAAEDSVAAQRVSFALDVLHQFTERKRDLGVLGYGDLLSGLADALRAPDAPAREGLRRQWKVVLIDEFQDTDPVQWEVFDRAFNGHATMILIGDPKQAIYAFRGGDVATYLSAASTADTHRTLDTNWRSDQPLVDATQSLLGDAALGDPQIRVTPVRARRQDSRLAHAPVQHPFRLRIVDTGQFAGSVDSLTNDRGAIRVGSLRPFLARDAARDIARLLGSGATYDDGEGPRPIRPSDVAVLANTNAQLELVQGELRRLGVPAVVSGSGSVFRTGAAAQWRALLEAMDRPHRPRSVRAAALTSFVGLSAVELDERGDAATDEVADRLRRWAAIFESRGVAAVFEAAVAGGLTARVLSRVDGERELTDLRHIAEALHAVALDGRRGLPSLLEWLSDQERADRPASGDARARRLDSDAYAVQLATIHGSKGLEYPIVYLPFACDRSLPRQLDNALLHLPGPPPVRSRNVGGPDPHLDDLARSEDAAESLRLLYVALTRAKSQVIAWWTRGTTTAASPLNRVLLDRAPGERAGSGAVRDVVPLPDSFALRVTLDDWAAVGGPQWERSDDLTDERLQLPAGEATLAVRRFDRSIDDAWRRTSYSALSRAMDDIPGDEPSSEPEQQPTTDEPDLVLPAAAEDGDPAMDRAAPMGELPVGATFGSLVHAVLETADPQAPDLATELRSRVHEQLLWWPVELAGDELVQGLLPVYDTPLGPLLPGSTLRSVGKDRLAELDFELPLVGGDLAQPDAPVVTLGRFADVLRRHLPAGDPLLPYADLLHHEVLGGQVLRGYLTGSIDVVLRVGDRYVVADYKTNWLGPADEPLRLRAYGPQQLAAAMGHSDYPLQALLYAVVLHRYLRWRLPGYRPERNLGGVLYLYLRGMAGADSPVVDGQPTGVFSWQPPAAMVVELSDLLDGKVTG